MADPIIRIKRSSVEGKIPTPDQVPLGEIALNTFDGKLYASKNVGVGTTVIAINPWTVGTGTNTYNTYFTNGNVGIGTTNPTEKLTVSGKIQILQDSGSNNRFVLRGQPASSYRWSVDNYGSSNDFRIFREDDVTAANGSVAVSISTTGTVTATKFSGDGSLLTNLPSSGGGSSQWVTTAAGIHTLSNVGIGTTNPTQKLEVVGGEIKAGRIDSSSEGGQLSFGRATDNTTGWYIDVYGSTSTPNLRFVDVSNAAVRAVIDGSGNFGIKNASPTSALDVTGDAKISGVVTSNGYNATTGNDYEINGTSVLTSTTLGSGVINSSLTSVGTLVSLNVSGIATLAGHVNLGDNTADNINVSGEFVSNLTPDATNTYDLGSSTQRWRDLWSDGTITSPSFVGDLTGTASTATAAGTAYGLTGSPNVVVGVVTATTFVGNLTGNVTGNINSSGVSTFTNGPVFIGSGTSTGTASQRLQVTGGAYIQSSVGIGTTNPTKSLVINGGNGNIAIGTVGTANAIWLNNSTATADYNILSNSLNNLNINRPSGKSIFFNQADTTTHATFDTSNNFILNSGGLGINNVTPATGYSIDGGAASSNAKGRVGSIIFGTAGTSYGIVGYNAKPSALNAWTYDVTDVASWVQFLSGGHVFYRGVSGTAGNTITALESVRFNSSGNVGINSSSPTSRLDVVGDVKVSGVITATDFNSTSDINLKENIKFIDNALCKIIKINGVEFDWKETKKHSSGVIAQNIEEVFPHLVNEIESHKTVNYNGLIGVLIEAIKDLKKEIEDLKNNK